MLTSTVSDRLKIIWFKLSICIPTTEVLMQLIMQQNNIFLMDKRSWFKFRRSFISQTGCQQVFQLFSSELIKLLWFSHFNCDLFSLIKGYRLVFSRQVILPDLKVNFLSLLLWVSNMYWSIHILAKVSRLMTINCKISIVIITPSEQESIRI